MMLLITTIAAFIAACVGASSPPPAGPACSDCPNIVLLLTDDQDKILGGWRPEVMDFTFSRMVSTGTQASSFRIHTPICAPSRSQLQTGRYYHNIMSNETTPSPAVSSGAVAQVAVADHVYPNQFATILREKAGYRTALFGKCMNDGCGARQTQDGTETIDLHNLGAYDDWFEGVGYERTTFFDTANMGCTYPYDEKSKDCQTKTFPGGVWAGRGDGYDVSTLGNVTVEWIRKQVKSVDDRPFFIYWGTHSPHSPATPPSWYEKGTFCDNITAPRPPNFNYSGSPTTSWSKLPPSGPPPFGDEPVWWWGGTEFHELVSSAKPFTEEDVAGIDDLAQKRCKTLLSVDDAYRGIFEAAMESKRPTYFIVTSDHGYNLGEHRIPSNKFLLYEHSLLIPMLFHGPGIAANASFDFMGTQVDVAPYILGLAGLDAPPGMDGKSFLGHVVSDASTAPGSVQRSLERDPAQPTRTEQFVTYFSQGNWLPDGRPLDDWSNTYIGVTSRDTSGHWKFGIYDPYGKQTNFTKPYMFELFDLEKDPFELHNVYNATLKTDPQLVQKLTDVTYAYYNCKGSASCPQ